MGVDYAFDEKRFSDAVDEAVAANKRKRAKDGAFDAEIIDLAKMPVGLFENSRKEAAKRLGMRATVLDKQVNAKRIKEPKHASPGDLLPHWRIDDWPEAVDTDALLRDVMTRIQRHIVCSQDTALIVALWIAFAWAHDAATFSPLLVISSAEPNSGKTTLSTHHLVSHTAIDIDRRSI
jgi:hypothetical protein